MTIAKNNALEETFTATGQSSTFPLRKSPYNFSISGTFVGTVVLQRSFDEGVTFLDVRTFTEPDERIGDEPEPGTLYRFNCTAFTSGSIVCRLGSYYAVGM